MATERGVDQVASMDSSIYSEPVFRSPVQPYESCLFDHDYTNVGVDNTVDIMNSSPDSGSGQSAFGRAFSSSTRKRLRSPNDWKRNKDKLARQKGQKYTNCGGVTVPTKQPPVGIQLCTRKCRLRCDEIHDDERLRIFAYLLNSTTLTRTAKIFISSAAYSHTSRRLCTCLPENTGQLLFLTTQSSMASDGEYAKRLSLVCIWSQQGNFDISVNRLCPVNLPLIPTCADVTAQGSIEYQSKQRKQLETIYVRFQLNHHITAVIRMTIDCT